MPSPVAPQALIPSSASRSITFSEPSIGRLGDRQVQAPSTKPGVLSRLWSTLRAALSPRSQPATQRSAREASPTESGPGWFKKTWARLTTRYVPAVSRQELQAISTKFEALNLAVQKDGGSLGTLPRFGTEHIAKGTEPKPLGKGALNTAYSVTYVYKEPVPDPAQPLGFIEEERTFQGVFKPLSKVEYASAAELSGIDPKDAQIAMRNLATCSVAEALGFDVAPKTYVAMAPVPAPFDPLADPPDEDEASPAKPEERLGLVMSMATGDAAGDCDPSAFESGEILKEITKLQLLDHLVGQVDRHGRNYFINVKEGRVTGIDNDQSFGHKLTDPAAIRKSGRDDPNNGTDLPPVIDREMAHALLTLSKGSLAKLLEGRLTPEEISSAQERLGKLQSHYAPGASPDLKGFATVIEKNQWSDPQVQKLFNIDNSYAARDKAAVIEERAMGAAKAKAAEERAAKRRLEASGATRPEHAPAAASVPEAEKLPPDPKDAPRS